MNAPANPTPTTCERANLRELRRIIGEAEPRQPKPLDHPPDLKHGWLLPYLPLADDFLWRRWHHSGLVCRLRVAAPVGGLRCDTL